MHQNLRDVTVYQLVEQVVDWGLALRQRRQALLQLVRGGDVQLDEGELLAAIRGSRDPRGERRQHKLVTLRGGDLPESGAGELGLGRYVDDLALLGSALRVDGDGADQAVLAGLESLGRTEARIALGLARDLDEARGDGRAGEDGAKDLPRQKAREEAAGCTE